MYRATDVSSKWDRIYFVALVCIGTFFVMNLVRGALGARARVWMYVYVSVCVCVCVCVCVDVWVGGWMCVCGCVCVGGSFLLVPFLFLLVLRNA